MQQRGASDGERSAWRTRRSFVVQALINEALLANDIQLALSWMGIDGFAAFDTVSSWSPAEGGDGPSETGRGLDCSDRISAVNRNIQLMHAQLMCGGVNAALASFARAEAAATAGTTSDAAQDRKVAALMHQCRGLLHLAHAFPNPTKDVSSSFALSREHYESASTLGDTDSRSAGVCAINAAVCSIYNVAAVDPTNEILHAALLAIESVVLDDARCGFGSAQGVANASCIYDLVSPLPAEEKRRLGAVFKNDC